MSTVKAGKFVTFHSNFVDNLRSIIDKTGAKIVISSSWRTDGLDIMKDLWKYRDLPGSN
jgi:precorrin-6B methylase 1